MTIDFVARRYPCSSNVDGRRYTKYPTGSPSVIVAAVTASGWGQSVSSGGTITGPAPLAVFFDATDTIHSGVNAYREIGYHHDFGYATPSTPGTWAHSGEAKGAEVGRRPMSAHVYETAGTYTYSLRAQDSSGNYSDLTVTIVAVDPDTYWTTGGRSTVDVSTGAAPTWASDTRYRFARGSDYSALTYSAINGLSRIALAATGSGADPILPALTIEQGNITTRDPWANCITLDSLDLRAGLSAGKPCEYVLQHGGSGRHTQWGVNVAWYWGSATNATRSAGWHYPRYITQHKVVLDAADAAGSYALSGSCSRWAILGCTLSESTYHNLRQFGFYKSVVAHNSMTASGSTYANMTNRSLGTDTTYTRWDEYDGTAAASRYLVAAYNTLGGASDTFAGSAHTIQPQDGNHAEGIEDVIIDHQTHARAAGGGLVVVARRVTEADNAYSSVSLDITQGADITPAEWFGPYYTDTTTPDGSLIFAAPAQINPSKAGS